MRAVFIFLLGLALGLQPGEARAASSESPRFYGVLQGTQEHAAEGYAMGLRVALISVSWDRFEPRPGVWNEAYIAELARKKAAFRKLGYKLQLDLGVQYAPEWAAALPHGRYRNQFGVEFVGGSPGERLPNVVFNGAVRRHLAGYFGKVFEALGRDWDFVRLGCGKWGELNYPQPHDGSHPNSYWGFDDLAQGAAAGLPEGMSPCPVPGWIPGTSSRDHAVARKFAEWYLDSLKAYQDWQMATVRQWFSGDLCMLYGSWGIRPGELEEAVKGDLNGATPAERNGEIQQGYDWARMIAGIADARVIVYCTWMDGTLQNRDLADDNSSDPRRWSPVHWQASLARQNPLRLRVWGENTGRNNRETMRRVFERIRRWGLMGVMWAFERELRAEPNPEGWATWSDFAEFIAEDSRLLEPRRSAPTE